jgi:hypothetical protein
MTKYLYNPKILVVLAVFGLSSCDDDNEKPNLRASLDYSLITSETPYSQLFVDDKGTMTVDLTEGNNLHKMFQSLNYYSTNSVQTNAHIEASTLSNMFSNTGDPFTDVSSLGVIGADLNASDFQLSNLVASSRPASEAAAVLAKFETLFEEIEAASHFVTETASEGNPGKLDEKYLVDAKGIEIAQIIQKSLIGALQVDYIGNVLMAEGLTADNTKVVGDNNYTQLEHNWDIAYGLLTLNQVYLQGWTADAKGTTKEFALGSYVWEYNKTNFPKMHSAFLKGRAAIVNNDRAELEAQATFIRTEFEKTLASAALGYLEKWKTGATEGARAHYIGEGLGFIYSLRFATIHGADASFSDDILNDLIGSENGFWDLDVAKINAASDAIKAKFNL